MKERRHGIDQAVSLFYDPEKDTTEVVLASGKHVVGEYIPFDDGDNRAFIVPDRRYGRPRRPELIETSNAVIYLI